MKTFSFVRFFLFFAFNAFTLSVIEAAGGAGLARQRKLTVATVCGKQDKWFERLVSEKKLRLMAVYGVARSYKPGSTALGGYVAFIGDFRAVNIATGEMFAASKIILPGIAEEALAGAMSGDGTSEVRFAIEIGAEYKAENATKYQYTLTPLTKMQDADAISELHALVVKSVPMLEDKSKKEADERAKADAAKTVKK